MLQLRDLSKNFGGFIALSGVNFEVGAGEIIGLLGENGAGKSTLLNIIGGNLQPSGGQLLWNGQAVDFASPRDATRCGIGVVHQHFMLVPVFSVAENMALHDIGGNAIFDREQWAARVQDWARQLGWKVDGYTRVADLSVGERQRVEILKALFAASSGDTAKDTSTHSARLLLLDEPTANLTPGEANELFDVVRRLKEQGRGVVFVSHKLNEVMKLCDRVVVLRHGKVAGERRIQDTDTRELASLMVGRELGASSTQTQSATTSTAPVRLFVEKLSCGALRDFSLQVRSGEIVGLAGVDGNGQRELIEVLSELRAPQAGTFRIEGDTSGQSRIAVIPPDRQESGLIASFDLAENMALQPALRAALHPRHGLQLEVGTAAHARLDGAIRCACSRHARAHTSREPFRRQRTKAAYRTRVGAAARCSRCR
jgi:simple sugar transport system ATP-binding protein